MRQGCIAGSSERANRVLTFSIVMGADSSSKLIFMPTWVPAFYAHNDFRLDRVLGIYSDLRLLFLYNRKQHHESPGQSHSGTYINCDCSQVERVKEWWTFQNCCLDFQILPTNAKVASCLVFSLKLLVRQMLFFVLTFCHALNKETKMIVPEWNRSHVL